MSVKPGLLSSPSLMAHLFLVLSLPFLGIGWPQCRRRMRTLVESGSLDGLVEPKRSLTTLDSWRYMLYITLGYLKYIRLQFCRLCLNYLSGMQAALKVSSTADYHQSWGYRQQVETSAFNHLGFHWSLAIPDCARPCLKLIFPRL